MRRAVFLDRDGVINRSVVRGGLPFAPHSVAEVEILPGVVEAVTELRSAGFLVIAVTNQPDVGRGRLRKEAVDDIHDRIRRRVPLDDLRVCFHTDEDDCACRKPRPGMLVDAARDWEIDLSASFMIGDRWRDIEAGHAAGCRTILIGQPYDERPAEGYWGSAASLLEASALILEAEKSGA